MTCTVTDDNSAGSANGLLSDSFTFALEYTACTNLQPAFDSVLGDLSLMDEASSSFNLPSVTDPNSGDSFTYTVIDTLLNTQPTWLAITGNQIDLTPTTSTMKTTYTLEVTVTDSNSCSDSIGTLTDSFRFDVTITDTNEAPVLSTSSGNFARCLNEETSQRQIPGPSKSDPNPTDTLTLAFSTTCSYLTWSEADNKIYCDWHLLTEADIGTCTYTFTLTDDDKATNGANILSDTYSRTFNMNYCNEAPVWASSITNF